MPVRSSPAWTVTVVAAAMSVVPGKKTGELVTRLPGDAAVPEDGADKSLSTSPGPSWVVSELPRPLELLKRVAATIR